MTPAQNRVERFRRFMVKRENIRIRKAKGLDPPWTKDPILQTYKFTNVKRHHDRTSYELDRYIYSEHRDAPFPIFLYNCAVFRYFGTSEFARAVGWQNKHNPDRLISIARKRLTNKERVFTGAYVISNLGIKLPKTEVVAKIFLESLWEERERLHKATKERYQWQDLIKELRTLRGFGGSGFMAKEVVLDTLYSHFWLKKYRYKPTDFQTYCPTGPGARRGILRLYRFDEPNKHWSKFNYETLLEIMIYLHAEISKQWPKHWQPLDLHDIQFQLCEFDKYERVRLGQGKPRSKYTYKAAS